MRFDNAEDFRIFVRELLKTEEFEEQLKQFSRTQPNPRKFNKDNWDWLEYDKLYLVSNAPTSAHGRKYENLFIIYYPSYLSSKEYEVRKKWVKKSIGGKSSDKFLFWVGISSSMENVGYWDIEESNEGKSWVTAFVKLSTPAVQSFLNWNNLPWGEIK